MVLSQFLVNGLSNGCLIALMSVGFALIYNTTRILNIAHGALYTGAAYFCYALHSEMGWGISVSILGALLLTLLLGVATESWMYWPLQRRHASPLVALLSGLGLYIVLVNIIAMVFGNETKALSAVGQSAFHAGGIIVTHIQLLEILVPIFLVLLLLLVLHRTGLGRNIRAVRDNPALVSLMGSNIKYTRMIVFGLGSVLSGVAAILSGADIGIDPNIGLHALLMAAVALVIGGIGSFSGAGLGGIFVGILQSLITWRFSSLWADASTFGVLVLFLLLRPQGLIGTPRRLEEQTG